MDETLYGVSEKVQNFAVIYLGSSFRVVSSWAMTVLTWRIVDITEVPDFNKVSGALFEGTTRRTS